MLSNAGLKVVKTQGFSVIWGLYDIPFLNSAGKSESASASTVSEKAITPIDTVALVKDRKVSLIKRLVVSEDASVPVLGLGVTFMRWAAANMMMYVCTPAE